MNQNPYQQNQIPVRGLDGEIIGQNPETLETLSPVEQVNERYEAQLTQLKEASRTQLHPEVKKSISPVRMIAEGVAKVGVNLVVDSADEVLGLADPVSEILLDNAAGIVTEKMTGRPLRNVSKMVSNPFSIFSGTHKRVTKKIAGKYKFRPRKKEVTRGFLKDQRQWLANKSYDASRKRWRAEIATVEKVKRFKLGPLPIGNAIPVVSGLISPGAIDGLIDIVEGTKALAKGQKSVEVGSLG